ncbi:hypothetical protein ND856_18505 [Leptospira bandrabouensis]|uniref:hypothetical protein n=1 Tax=Leptospira bandrabouensis TaxID=2484903 RepID=UPI00223D2BB7|nr:hypothetical protein [Leptospira bandrabouensis]MCW7460185.1 hypothetical protein [Leptospira bandrabouensis]MCW7479298.1 hypothetical protein [Leptospira bandrabouensis]MCW7486979.1 hypothetical protein [Leptospira bandrabouensis]
MTDSITLKTNYAIKYTTKDPVPLDEILESLRGLKDILERTPSFIEHKYPDIRVDEIKIFIQSIQSGSLKEDILIELVFGGRENYDSAKATLQKILQDSKTVRTIVAIGVGALIGGGVAYSLSGKNEPTTNIQAYNNNIVNIGSGVNFSGDDIAKILDSIGDREKKKLAQSAISVVKPAKNDDSATIEFDNDPRLTISNDFVKETPVDYSAPVADIKTETYINRKIEIFASDRDRKESVWAGIVPGIIDKRIRFILENNIDAKKLHEGKRVLNADIAIVSKHNSAKKKYEVANIIIQKVY